MREPQSNETLATASAKDLTTIAFAAQVSKAFGLTAEIAAAGG